MLRPTIISLQVSNVRDGENNTRSANAIIQLNLTVDPGQLVVLILNEWSVERPISYMFKAAARQEETTEVIVPVDPKGVPHIGQTLALFGKIRLKKTQLGSGQRFAIDEVARNSAGTKEGLYSLGIGWSGTSPVCCKRYCPSRVLSKSANIGPDLKPGRLLSLG